MLCLCDFQIEKLDEQLKLEMANKASIDAELEELITPANEDKENVQTGTAQTNVHAHLQNSNPALAAQIMALKHCAGKVNILSILFLLCKTFFFIQSIKLHLRLDERR